MKAFIITAVLSLTAQSALAEQWEKVLTCNNGAAVVDVNTENRNEVQIVVRDIAIVSYFLRSGVSQSRNFIFHLNHEFILRGKVKDAVYFGNDFSSMSVIDFSDYRKAQSASVWKNGEGLKILINENNSKLADWNFQYCR